MRIRSTTYLPLAAVTIILGLTYAFVLVPAGRQDRAKQDAVARTATDLMHALGRGDGPTACGLLSKPAATSLATRQGAANCPAAVTSLSRSLNAEQRDSIAAAELTGEHVTPRKKDPLIPVNLPANPFDFTQFLVTERNGEWRIVRLD
ncbi:hypothetical protein [Streptomyces sp. DH10]|uniref:hypothetical protein n=1 Tax=Streptomyces sp. DH10 TaxID=3040121 RepID=UPI0024424114|nr:hypothetical protein [Streptomyces sp. DH10]MDG9714499.1 hypothetical protein [Streptomyces sp. DH10]